MSKAFSEEPRASCGIRCTAPLQITPDHGCGTEHYSAFGSKEARVGFGDITKLVHLIILRNAFANKSTKPMYDNFT